MCMHEECNQTPLSFFLLFFSITAPQVKESGDLNAGDLNAGGQISLSCHKEVIKATNYTWYGSLARLGKSETGSRS